MIIITHAGQAHFDDFAAVSIMLAHYKRNDVDAIIERKFTVTPQELASSQYTVIDIGGEHSDHFLNFDHHQFDRNAAPRCALSLVLDFLGVYKPARNLWPWLEGAEVFDCKGPKAAQEFVGAKKSLISVRSDIEKWFLGVFSKQTTITYDENDASHILWHFMLDYGESRLVELDLLMKRQELWKNTPTEKIGDIIAIDVSELFGGRENPLFGVEYFLRGRNVEVMLFKDDRGGGVGAIRRQNAEKFVDFSKVENHQLVSFAHKQGFIVKFKHTATKEEIREIIKLSACPR